MKNFYLLYGSDDSIIMYELDKILNKLNINDVVKYDMTSSLIDDVIIDAFTISLFSSLKVIVLDNCNFFVSGKNLDGIKELEKYVENYNSDTYMIFIVHNEKVDTRRKIYKLISANGAITFCKADFKYLSNYISDYVLLNGYKLEDTGYFLSIVGNDLNNITNELDKLFMYKLNDKIITKSDIDKLVIKNIEDEIFVLVDSIILHDNVKSFNLLNNFLNKNYDEVAIIMLLASQFRFLFQIKRLSNKNLNYNEIAKVLEVNPYRVKFSLSKLYSYTEYDLINSIKRLASIDHDIKYGLVDKRLALEMFIFSDYSKEVAM